MLTAGSTFYSPLELHYGESMDELVQRAVALTEDGTAPAALALSGGGDMGAFGAGFLTGWTQAGRPEFRIVTGVSTGALLATFAFLGPAYDKKLKEAYTTITRADILRDRLFLTVPFSDSLTRTKPLRKLIEKYVDRDVLRDVAQAGAQGRVLLVGTVNLDRGSFSVWNLTALACSDYPNKVQRYQQILLASASVPFLMEPVFIDGAMHVDGGAREQVFMREFVPDLGQAVRQLAAAKGAESVEHATVYVVANSKFGLDPKCVQDHLLPIAVRSVSALADEALIGNIFRIYTLTLLDTLEFRVTFIDPGIPTGPDSATFDPEIMKGLFDHGVTKGRNQQWDVKPPTVSDEEHAALQKGLAPR